MQKLVVMVRVHNSFTGNTSQSLLEGTVDSACAAIQNYLRLQGLYVVEHESFKGFRAFDASSNVQQLGFSVHYVAIKNVASYIDNVIADDIV